MSPQNNKSEKSSTTSKLLAISILSLAASLAWFTFELSRFIRQIPDILENVRQTSEQIEPVLDEVVEIRKLVKPVLVEVNTISEQIPSILLEVKSIRESIPLILDETASIRKTLPPILDEAAAIRTQLPTILASADKATETITLVSAEVNAWQPIAKDALIQVEGIRKEVPIVLDRTEAMIGQARVAARDASSGAITGALGGLLSAPFRLVGNFGSSVLGLSSSEADDYSKEDIDKLKAHSIELLQNGVLGDSSKWENRETKRRAELTLQKIYQDDDDQQCREILIKSWLESTLTLEKAITACQNADGEWEDQD